jgi:hypothetical protein
MEVKSSGLKENFLLISEKLISIVVITDFFHFRFFYYTCKSHSF